jgi:hypothetical protein
MCEPLLISASDTRWPFEKKKENEEKKKKETGKGREI